MYGVQKDLELCMINDELSNFLEMTSPIVGNIWQKPVFCIKIEGKEVRKHIGSLYLTRKAEMD